MRITEVETVVVDGGMRNWVLVQVRTDEGISGLGEATLEGKAETMVAAVAELTRLIDGQDLAGSSISGRSCTGTRSGAAARC